MRSTRFAMICCFAFVAGFAARGGAAPSIAQLGAQLGLDADEIARVQKGEVVHGSRSELSERDLAVGFVLFAKAPPATLAQGFRRADDLANDPSIVASHRIARVGAANDLASLQLRPRGADEAKRYLAAQPGDTLNLSDAELAAFHGLGAAATQDAVTAQLRKLLLVRHDSYRTRGIAGIAPYAREGGQRRELGEGLRVLAQPPPGLERYVPAVRALLHGYPKLPPGAEETYYWLLYDHDDRPTVSLRHRMTLAIDGSYFIADREFFVSQGYNELQGLAALMPVEGGTLILYRADTSTDRVSGTGSTMKHSIGRRMMAKQLQEIFERTRNKLAK